MIKTVRDLIEALQGYHPDRLVMTEKYINRWSGSDEDTDLSGYEPVQISRLMLECIKVPWDSKDQRRKDKRRTLYYDTEEVLVIQGDV